MNRFVSLLVASGGLIVFPLMDSAIKGTIVLLVATASCLALRRDSAATRHFVWVVAICLLIAMPVLSLVLPGWQVLPSWLRADEPAVVASYPPSFVPSKSSLDMAEIPKLASAMSLPESFMPGPHPSVEETTREPGFEAVETTRVTATDVEAASPSPIPWTAWLSGIWFTGCIILVTRLLAATVLLRRAARRSVIVADAPASGMRQLPGTMSSQNPDSPTENLTYRPVDTGRSTIIEFHSSTRSDAQPLAVADAESQRLQNSLIQAKALLGVKRPIQLLLDPHRSIPIVWGLIKTRLQLPAEAVNWNDQQLQSVLLHELAHVRRRDLFVLALTQIACALHWFNPLVWVAAWRLHVERERACDDLVLASGVRASAYAEHLLNVAAQLRSSQWTQACGLAMARNSSLHTRLTAVLCEKQNRRSVTTALLILSVVVSSAVAIPIAMLRAADEKASGESVANQSVGNEAVVKEPLKPGADPGMDVSLIRGVWSAAGAGRWLMPQGVSLELKQECFHAADIATSVVLTWPEDASGTTYAYTSYVASDAFANREPWHVAWEKDSTTFWSMTGNLGRHAAGLATPSHVRRIDFTDKMNIVTTTWYHQPEEMPEGIRLEFEKVFKPLPATPRLASQTEGFVQVSQAHDVRPIDELLHGVWKNEEGEVGVQLTFPERDTDGIQWTVDYGKGIPAVAATMARINSPAENSIRLWMPSSQVTNVDEKDIVGTVRRGPDSSLLLDVTGSPRYPEYKKITGIVLMRDSMANQETARQLQNEIDFARIAVAKARVDLEQRREANKKIKAFNQKEMDETESQVSSAEAKLKALLERAEIQRPAKAMSPMPGLEQHLDGSEPGDGLRPNGGDTGNEFPKSYSQDWQDMPTIPVYALCTDAWIDFHEQHLDWSEPVNGLRAAVRIRWTPATGIDGKERKIFLVVQNVSDQPIRFCDTAIEETDVPAADTEGRTLYLQDTEGILMGMQRAVSTKTDQVLQPRHMLSIDMFDNEEPKEQGHKTGDMIAHGIVKIPSRSLFAVLKIVNAPEGAWTGKLATPSTRGAFAAQGPMPKSKEGQTLFRYCLDHARTNGKIPGGLMNRLHDMVQEFIGNNSGDTFGDSYAKKMEPLLVRFEQKEDWKQSDIATLFDDIAAVTTIPLEKTMDQIREHTLQRGQQLPASLNNANWGEALPGGLRMAWILEPQAGAYHLGSSLKSRVVIHNSGKEPVAFVTRSFHQPTHKAKTAVGAPVQIESTSWLTRGQPEPYRLHPGEYCEVNAPGIGIGPNNPNNDDWANVRPGSWILAEEGEDVIFQPGEVMLTGDHNHIVDPDWWLTFIKERINRDAPLPADQKEREVILFRVVSDLFGNSPTPEEAAAFYPDMTPEALTNLATLLSKRTWLTPVAGPIKSGETKFRVLAEDPEAATRPRLAMNPGRYSLGDEIRLVVTRRPVGHRIVNEADLVWYPKGKDPVPLKISLPDGYNTWAAAWLPGTTVLWIHQKASMRRYDFEDPAAIKETRFGPNEAPGEPKEIHDAIMKAFDIPDAPVQQAKPPAAEKPAEMPVSKLRAVNRTGSYEVAGQRRLSICKPKGLEQRFSIFWPTGAGEPKRGVKIVPNAPRGTHWSVVLDEEASTLWWIDDTDVGKMNFSDPEQVIVERESRKHNFSRDFELPDSVKEEFVKLGFEIGRELTREKVQVPAGTTGRREVFKAGPLTRADTEE